MMSLISSSSLKFSSLFSGSRTLFTATPDYFKITPQLWKEPLKKKKKIDPAVAKMKTDRRRKNLEREIRMLKRAADQLKPIDEQEVPSAIKNNIELRKRNIPKLSLEEELLRRRIDKRWCHYKTQEHVKDFKNINNAMQAAERALEKTYYFHLQRYNTLKMKITLLLLAVIVSASARTTIDKEWEAFKTKFNKEYSAEEDARRYKIFTENKALIAEHNKKFDEGKVTFTMGINKFADMTSSDTSFLRGYKSERAKAIRKSATTFKKTDRAAYPNNVDWRVKGYVTPVKDQGECGSCWAFSAVGSLEGQHFASAGNLVSLSEQNLVDCVQAAFGCDGGNMVTAFHYIKGNDGIDTEESYPYKAENGMCQYDPEKRGATCDGSVVLDQTEDALLEATATIGPISVAIDASQESFQRYESGVYYELKCSSTNLDHGVLVVGYGT